MNVNRHKIEIMLAKNCLSLTQVAELSNTSRQRISEILRRGTCRPATLGRIARALGVDPAELIEEEEHD